VIALACGACTIDPVARAELAGITPGDAIFQRAGTSSQVSYEITLTGEDGVYDVLIETGSACEAPRVEWARVGVIEILDGTGLIRGVRNDWDVGSGANDVVGRLLVARRSLFESSCGEIESSD
jgi:hypothetical protein